jgi:hypothetical protein
LGPGNRNQFPVHPGLPAINLVLLLGCGQAEPKARIPGSIGCLCTLQAELDARLMHALDEGDFDFKVVHGAKSCMGQSRAWGKVVHGAASGELIEGGWAAAREEPTGGGCLGGCSCWGWQGERTSIMRGPLIKANSPLACSLSATSPSQLSLHQQAHAPHAA